MNLQELEKEETDLNYLLSINRERQRVIHTNNFLSKYGIKFGDTVEFMDGSEKITGVFDRIEYNGVKVAHPFVKQLNSDGKVGKRDKRCWWSGLNTLKLVKSAEHE